MISSTPIYPILKLVPKCVNVSEAVYLQNKNKYVCTHTPIPPHKLIHAYTKGQIFKLKPMYIYLLGKWSTKNKGKMSLS